jgi:hypothetical protein
MATFYVMDPKQKHTYTEVLAGLLSHQTYFLDYIKDHQFDEEELAGLKLFLQKNNYDLQLLKQFIEPPALNPQTKKQTHLGNYYKIAAGVLLLITFSVFTKLYFFNNQSIQNYWVQDTGFKVLMGNETNSAGLANGMSFYKAEQYKQAIAEFSLNSFSDTAAYYSGICFIKLNELDSAEKYLLTIPQTSIYKNKAMYYLALSYFYNDKKSKALDILNTIIFSIEEMELKKKLIIQEYKTK